MANFIEALGESINRASCVVLGGLAGQEELLRYVLEPLQTGNPGYNGLGALYAQNCDRPPPGRPDPPFTGGQCNAFYKVFYSGEYRGGAPGSANDGYIPFSSQTAFNVLGAVTGIGSQVNAQGNGARVQIFGAGAPVNGFGFTTTNSAPFFRNLKINSVSRESGLPDNCGDPPPIPPVLPPGGNVYNDNTTFINNEGDTITIPISVTLGYAQVNFNGQLSIPISVDFSANPELNFEGDYNFNTGDVNINIGNPALPRPGKDGTPKDYTSPDTPAIPDELPPEIPLPPYEPQAEQYDVIRAAIVTTTVQFGLETVIFQDENPNIFAPALGHISFLIQIGDRQAWTNDIPVKNKRAFIECPWEAGAIDVKGTARPGNEISVSPVYVTATRQPTYP